MVLAIIIAVVLATSSLFAMVETKTTETWEKKYTFNGPKDLEKEFTFSDTTYLRMTVEYISCEGTPGLNVTIGNKTFLDNNKSGYCDTTNVQKISPGKYSFNVIAGNEKDRWKIVIYKRKIKTIEVGKTKIKQQKKNKMNGIFIKSFEAIVNRQIRKYNVVVRHRDYTWTNINIKPFIGFIPEFTAKSQIELAAHESNWRKPVVTGLLNQIQIYLDSNGKKGFKFREMKPGDELNWMFSGGGLMDDNLITLDVGKIIMRVSKYCSYYENLPETRRTHPLQKGDNIQAISFEFPYEGTMYVVLWFESTLGGIDQCGNLGGMSFPTAKPIITK